MELSSGVTVSIVIDATPDVVWAQLEDISSHVHWMHDAVAIRFTSPATSGAGTTFDCDTKIGPLRVTDRMEITEWSPGKAMGVRHVGVVTGAGRFTLRAVGARHCEFTWSEKLTFPWWMGGPLGVWASTPVLSWVWRRNLRSLAEMIEAHTADTDS